MLRSFWAFMAKIGRLACGGPVSLEAAGLQNVRRRDQPPVQFVPADDLSGNHSPAVTRGIAPRQSIWETLPGSQSGCKAPDR